MFSTNAMNQNSHAQTPNCTLPRRIRYAAAGVLLCAALTVSGCGRGVKPEFSSTNNAINNGATDNGVAAKTSDGKPVRIVVIAGDPKSNWEAAHQGALSAEKSFGVQVEWKTPDPKKPLAAQKKIVDDAVQSKVAGIVIAPIDPKTLASSVTKAKKKSVPTVVFDASGLAKLRLAYSANAHFKSGVLAARRAGKTMAGKGKVGVLFTPNSRISEQTARGFRETMVKEFANIEIVPNATAKTAGLKFLFAADEATTSVALKSLAPGTKLIAAADNAPAVEALRNKKIDALVVPNRYEMVRESIRAIMQHRVQQAPEPHVNVSPVLVASDKLQSAASRQVLGLK